ncbi:Drug/metabolite transporter, partial [Globisporangium splendens]
MPVPAAVGIAIAAAANTESGKKAMKQLEELPLLAARHAGDAAIRTGSRLPRVIQKWYAKLSATQLKGMILVAASAFTFSLLSTLIKYASQSMPSMETVFWRSFVAWLLNLIAVQGAIVLKEKIDLVNMGYALFSFAGVICVARPSFIFGSDHATAATDGSVFAIMCALLGAAAQAVAYVSMRRLQQVNYLVVINYFLLTSSVMSALSLLLVQRKFVIEMSLDVWLAVLGTGFLGFVGQLFLTRGFQLESAGTASVMRYLDVVFVFIWDITLLHERINEWSAVGAVIICGSAIAIAIRKMRS